MSQSKIKLKQRPKKPLIPHNPSELSIHKGKKYHKINKKPRITIQGQEILDSVRIKSPKTSRDVSYLPSPNGIFRNDNKQISTFDQVEILQSQVQSDDVHKKKTITGSLHQTKFPEQATYKMEKEIIYGEANLKDNSEDDILPSVSPKLSYERTPERPGD